MWREEECARQWRGLQGWYAYIYIYMCPTSACTPCTEDLLSSLIPDVYGAPFMVMAITESAHPALAWLHGYLPDTHTDGCLTSSKPHPIAHVLEAGASKASLQLW